MKKYVIKISLTFVIIAALALILLVLRTSDGDGTAPSYRFLAGRSPVACTKPDRRGFYNRWKENIRYFYSFEADFNDIYSKADTELIPAGFYCSNYVVKNLSGDKFPCRGYQLKGGFTRGSVLIKIYDNRQYTELPNPQEDALYMKDGWIEIEIAYWRGWRLFFDFLYMKPVKLGLAPPILLY